MTKKILKIYYQLHTTVELSEINNNNKVDNLEFPKLGGHMFVKAG